jgi:hypothetical protein
MKEFFLFAVSESYAFGRLYYNLFSFSVAAMTETNNANLDFANEVCEGRVASSTKKNYTSMYSHFISWISKNHENLLTADCKDVNFNAVSEEDLLTFFGHICKKRIEFIQDAG